MRARPTSTDARWLATVLADTPALLRDHAHCERKAAGTAMALVARHPEHARLVDRMAELAAEELEHFRQVHQHLRDRGLSLGPDLGDPYAKALVTQGRRDEPGRLVDRLLVSALIEARSCERLLLLGEHHPDPALRTMFREFAKAEASHGHLFVSLAREIDGDRPRADARLTELADFEHRWLETHPIRCAMH